MRPKNGLFGWVSVASQFLSSETAQVLLCWARTGLPKVAPPSVDRDTATAVGHVTSKTSEETYTLPSAPNATTGSEARSKVPPTALVSPGSRDWCQWAPPSCVQA